VLGNVLVALTLHFFLDQGDGRLQVHDVSLEDDFIGVVFGHALPDVLHVAGITGGVESIASPASLHFLLGLGFDAVGLDLTILDLLVHLQGLERLVQLLFQFNFDVNQAHALKVAILDTLQVAFEHVRVHLIPHILE